MRNQKHTANASFVLIMTLVLAACTQDTIPPAHNGDVDEKLCEHYRGEVPYDAARARFIAKQVELYCD